MSTADRTLAIETDTRLAALHGQANTLNAQRTDAVDAIHTAAGDRKQNTGRRTPYRDRPWTMTLDEAITADVTGYEARNHGPAVARLATLDAELATLTAEIAAGERVRDENGTWNRFFLVPAGHLHRDMRCPTCNRGRQATTFAWLPHLSGLTEADAIATLDNPTWLCSRCFPSAPVAMTAGKAPRSLTPTPVDTAALIAEQTRRDADAAWQAMQSPELDDLLRVFNAAEMAEAGTNDPALFEAAKTAFRAMQAAAPDGWSAPRRAKELGLK